MNVVRPAMLRPTLTYAEKGHILVSGISYEDLAIFTWPLCKGLFFLIESFFIFFSSKNLLYVTLQQFSTSHVHAIFYYQPRYCKKYRNDNYLWYVTYCMKFDWKRDDWCFLFFHATVQTWCGFIRTKFVSLNPIIQCVMYISITCYSRVT